MSLRKFYDGQKVHIEDGTTVIIVDGSYSELRRSWEYLVRDDKFDFKKVSEERLLEISKGGA